jgi:hypothetical protein
VKIEPQKAAPKRWDPDGTVIEMDVDGCLRSTF